MWIMLIDLTALALVARMNIYRYLITYFYIKLRDNRSIACKEQISKRWASLSSSLYGSRRKTHKHGHCFQTIPWKNG